MKYFENDRQLDPDAYAAQFTDDAVVEDDGHVYRGTAEIRAWRVDVPLVAYEVEKLDERDGIADAEVRISGDFPGSPILLAWHFEFAADGRIAALRIEPVG